MYVNDDVGLTGTQGWAGSGYWYGIVWTVTWACFLQLPAGLRWPNLQQLFSPLPHPPPDYPPPPRSPLNSPNTRKVAPAGLASTAILTGTCLESGCSFSHANAAAAHASPPGHTITTLHRNVMLPTEATQHRNMGRKCKGGQNCWY
ncbi:hypothetical protein J6590_037388 [Homalodisca vitripennis]|nr:hypothetical protein J6590_037388 [Homalodisca vitripennis]